jgi:GNAT superfamily N-acetyltransferase
MQKISFKTADIKDLSLIQNLAKKIWYAHYIDIISKEQIEYMLNKMYSWNSLKDQIQKQNHQFTLLLLDDIAVGYASMSTRDGKSYFLHKFYIDTQKHHQGLGTKFLNYLESTYFPEVIELTVNRQNYKAINFYFKNGFIIDKVADFDIGNGFEMNDFVMKKYLIN